MSKTIRKKEEDVFSGGTCWGGKWTGDVLVGGYKATVMCTAPQNLSNVWISKKNDVIMGYNGDCMYILNNFSQGFVSRGSFEKEIYPYVCTYYNEGSGYKTAFFCGNREVIYGGGVISTTTASARTCGGVMHRSRIFAISVEQRDKILWTDITQREFSLLGLNDAGEIRLTDSAGGDILKLVECGDDVVAVRKNGIAVLHALGKTENFAVSYCDTLFPNIEERSVAVCQNKVLFVGGGNLYCFTNGNARQIDLDGLRFKSVTASHARGSEYFIACRISGMETPLVLCYNTANGKICFIDLQVKAFCGEDELYAVCGQNFCKIEPTEDFLWKSKSLSFGTCGNKMLREVSVAGSGIEYVKVTNERGHSLKKVSKNNVFRFTLPFKQCVVEVRSQGHICGVIASAEV